MTDIVIAGAGKAGFLHCSAYFKMHRQGMCDIRRVRLVDPTGKPGPDLADFLAREGLSLPVHADPADLPPLDPDHTIIDLCLPSRLLARGLREWAARGFRKFVVEKPLLVSPEDQDVFELVRSRSVILVQNYLHSKVHKCICRLIADHDLRPLMILTNFSKDRRQDSARGRAFADGIVPSVFEIEMPHQLYIGNHLGGPMTGIYHLDARDMVIGDRVLSNHGEGVVVGSNADGNLFVHYSSLAADRVVRSIDIFFRDDYCLHGIYAPICENLNDLKAGVILRKGKATLAQHVFVSGDDNMLGMIRHAYVSLRDDRREYFADADELRSSACILQSLIANQMPPNLPSVPPQGLGFWQRWMLSVFRTTADGPQPRAFLDFVRGNARAHFGDLLSAPTAASMARGGLGSALPLPGL